MRFCELCERMTRRKDCPECGADTVKYTLLECYQCEGDGYGPNYVGNCPVCGGGGKVRQAANERESR